MGRTNAAVSRGTLLLKRANLTSRYSYRADPHDPHWGGIYRCAVTQTTPGRSLVGNVVEIASAARHRHLVELTPACSTRKTRILTEYDTPEFGDLFRITIYFHSGNYYPICLALGRSTFSEALAAVTELKFFYEADAGHKIMR